ncbi:MAG: glycosyltransferase family 4 protein [Sphingobacteriales bacterium]|nr:glycosyltransferase family 4 protein [Sphingobacteriales bacterium]
MNILMVNWTWFPSGGDWTYIENMTKIYQDHSHQVIPFSMHHEQNMPTPYQKYFVKHINYRAINQKPKLTDSLKVLTKSIYSKEAVKNITELLQKESIDLVHLNLIHHYLTPAIIKPIKEAGIPIIWTLHDYTILCPEGTFFSNNQVCEDCKVGKFYQATIHKCKKQSTLASLVATLDNYSQHFLNFYDDVDYFICPSKFVYQKFLDFGFQTAKLHHIYHSYDLRDFKLKAKANDVQNTKPFIVFVGRLETYKGVWTLLKAMKSCKNVALKIIGTGSLEEDLKAFAQSEGLNHVSFEGKKPKEEVLNIIRQSEFLICPSEWYEVFGFILAEAMLMEKPVIGSRIGAIPEMVIDGKTGFLFSHGNERELAEKINILYQDKALAKKMGKQAAVLINEISDPSHYYQQLKKVVPILT